MLRTMRKPAAALVGVTVGAAVIVTAALGFTVVKFSASMHAKGSSGKVVKFTNLGAKTLVDLEVYPVNFKIKSGSAPGFHCVMKKDASTHVAWPVCTGKLHAHKTVPITLKTSGKGAGAKAQASVKDATGMGGMKVITQP